MVNNDVLRRLRYALDLSNPLMIEAFRLGGRQITRAELVVLLKKEGEEGYLELPDPFLEDFLDGFIVLKRGQRAGDTGSGPAKAGKVSNNDVLKKLRIALELKEADLLEIYKLAGFPASKSEVSALFRTKGHDNYKECGDQMLRNFLKGLTVKYRDLAPSQK